MEQKTGTENKVPYPESYFQGLDKIKLAAIVLVIGTLLSLLAFFLSFVAIAAAIIIIVIVYVELLSGFKLLKESNPEYNIGLTGVYAILLGAVILFIGGVIFFVIPISGALIILVGGVISILAEILIAVGLFRLGSDAGNGLMEVGAILVFIISFIGWILVYISIGEIKERARKRNVEAQSFKSSP